MTKSITMVLVMIVFSGLVPAIIYAIWSRTKSGKDKHKLKDLLLAFVPGAIWIFLILLNVRVKSLSNGVIEIVLLQVMLIILMSIVIVLRSKQSKWYDWKYGVSAGMVLAMAIYYIMPTLPE